MATPPAWLAELANSVAEKVSAVDFLPPVGCHYYFNECDDQWEITIFCGNTEIVGGMKDGQIHPATLAVDLRGLLDVFPVVSDFYWQTGRLGPDDQLGPHVSLEGNYAGHSVWLRILSCAPEDFQSGRQVKVYERRMEDVW